MPMKGGKVLGLDWGSKRMGIAVSDAERKVASSSYTYERENLEEDLNYIGRVVDDREISLIVVGMPILTDGSEGEIAEKVRKFVEELRKKVSVSVVTIDERLTSAEAERVLLSSDLSREQRKKHRDKLAATLILQRYLDRENN